MRVHILATCRSPELAPYTELVFKTLRVGFPTAQVIVYLNRDCADHAPSLLALCAENKFETADANTIHHKWIQALVESESEPFFTCDTDIVFYENFERFTFSGPLAGFRVPEWQDEFSGAITRSRLHPSLLYIDPTQVKAALSKFRSVTPETDFTPFCNPFYPTCQPLNGRMYFHDTVSLLYHAIGGEEFTSEQKDAYFHFHFGTIPDVVLPRLSDADAMREARENVLASPNLGCGMWRSQEQYFEHRTPELDGESVIAEITPDQAEEARKWNHELCKGNVPAMQFNNLWYQYCHGIDDLLDSMRDGRPRMSKEQILKLFGIAAALYSDPFFVAYRNQLLPIVLMITNIYADSVAWEKSPMNRRRIMADVLRTCGDEMYSMIALLTGGWDHMRTIGPKIRDRDWIGQHDANDNCEHMTYRRAG